VEILALLVEGSSNAEIAGRLHISPKTADHHVSAVLAKLDVHSRQAAADLARRHPQLHKK
jgi:DNA-binding NarL/FixJ family response regulator